MISRSKQNQFFETLDQVWPKYEVTGLLFENGKHNENLKGYK